MTIKIIIKRKFKNANEKNVSEVIYEFRNCDDPNLILVFSMWQKKEDWDKYMKSPVRKKTEEKYAELFERPTEYESYHLGLPFAHSDHDFVEPLEF
jgi:heme-degrading monooxygenase HmoA